MIEVDEMILIISAPKTVHHPTVTLPTTPYSEVMATPNPQNFSPEDLDRIIMMAWEDRTPFEAIYAQFGLTENQVIQLMRQIQPQKTFKRWRMRASGRKTKHSKLRPENVNRFKSDDQKF